MSKKNKAGSGGFVFSTDPNFQPEQESEEKETIPPSEQRLKVSLQTKHRAGKTVTLITGFTGKLPDAEALGKQLRNHCGTGGSVKEDEIVMQGDHREKVLQFLMKSGYQHTKKQ
jgi:translation initiation factor 1